MAPAVGYERGDAAIRGLALGLYKVSAPKVLLVRENRPPGEGVYAGCSPNERRGVAMQGPKAGENKPGEDPPPLMRSRARPPGRNEWRRQAPPQLPCNLAGR